MNIQIVLLLFSLLVYMSIILFNFSKWRDNRNIIAILEEDMRETSMKLFFFERSIFKKLNLVPDDVKFLVYIIRISIIILFGMTLFFLRGLSILVIGAILIVIFTEDAYKRVIYESGITNVNNIVNFINYFVPHISSGNSADQSFISYIEYSKNNELLDYYENRDNLHYKIKPHLKQIVEIYEIAKYNEEQGISEYTYILNEMSHDYAQKQVYYNSFISRIGEIKPIILSYYLGVPLLILISFKQTRGFWMGLGGIVTSFIILVLFALFRFLIFKLQENTIKGIF